MMVEPCTDPRIFSRVMNEAYTDLPLTPYIYPQGIKPHHELILISICQQEMQSDPQAVWKQVVNDGGDVMAIAKWARVPAKPADEEQRTEVPVAAQSEDQQQQQDDERHENPPPADLNLGLLKQAAVQKEQFVKTYFGQRPYIDFGTLATLPEHQRKGAGKMLLEQCLQEADCAGLEVTLSATTLAESMYITHGFHIEGQVKFELPDGSTQVQNRLVRNPQS